MSRTAGSGLLVVVLGVGLGTGALSGQVRGRGLRQAANQPPGIQLELGYAGDIFTPLKGGDSQDVAALDNLDLLLHLSLNPLLGLRRTSIRVHVQSNRGESVSSGIGDLQGISNLEAPEEWRLHEAWIGHQFGAPRLSVLAGIYDLNAEFDVIPGAGDFLNSSFGLSPEFGFGGVAGPPTYPNTGLATRLRYEPSPSFYGLLALTDGLPGDQGSGRYCLESREGALVALEAGYARPLLETLQTFGRGPLGEGRGATDRPQVRSQRQRIGRGRRIEDVAAKVAIGAWAYTRRMEGWDPGEALGRSWGLYLLGESLLHQAKETPRALSGFARVGLAAEAVHRLDLSLGGGLTCRGALPGRPDDVLGLGAVHARNGSSFLRAQEEGGLPRERGETVIELTYRAAMGRYLVLQPDLQWVRNPGMDPAASDVLVLGIRGHLHLSLTEDGPGSY